MDKCCRERVFEIPDIITLNTKGLDGTPFYWRHYGGPLALFRLCRFVRIEILKDQPTTRKSVPVSANGPRNWAQTPQCPCDYETLKADAFPEANDAQEDHRSELDGDS